MVNINKSFVVAVAASLAILFSAISVQAVVLYSDDFNRGAWVQLLGNTSIGNYAWQDTASDMSRIVDNTLTIHGSGGYNVTYVQFNMDTYASYTVEFDFKVAAGLATAPALFLSPRAAGDASAGTGWAIQNVDGTLIIMYGGAGVSGNAGQAGQWIHVRIDVDTTTANLYFGSQVIDTRTTIGTANDGSADYVRFGYYWAGDYGLLNWQVDNLSVVSPKTAAACGDFIHPYPAGDFTQDCYVNLADFAILAAHWLDCSDPEAPCLFNP